MLRAQYPKAGPRQSVGLFGGSFDPPHAGHVHISREALKRLRLDALWWLVSPGNPLKPTAPATLQRRIDAARKITRHPKVQVTDVEARLGTRYTAQTLARLQALYPATRFVWIMGADNLSQFHHWQDWREIMARVPVAVFARPGERISARTSPAATIFRDARLPASAAAGLARHPTPAWSFLNVPMRRISSSEIRATGAWSGHNSDT